MKSYISGLEEKVVLLQQKIESLEIVINKKIKDSENFPLVNNMELSNSFQNKKPSIYDALKDIKIWNNIQHYLTGEDIANLFLVSSCIREILSKRHSLFTYLVKNISIDKPIIMKKPEIIHGLVKK